jgi:DNA-binding transcriptional ArsR family regulator
MKDVWSALSDSTRREILQLLREKDMSAGEIASNFNMSKPSISKHLDILKQAELISSKKQGQFIIYSLNTSVMEDIAALIMSFVSKGNDLNKEE